MTIKNDAFVQFLVDHPIVSTLLVGFGVMTILFLDHMNKGCERMASAGTGLGTKAAAQKSLWETIQGKEPRRSGKNLSQPKP